MPPAVGFSTGLLHPSSVLLYCLQEQCNASYAFSAIAALEGASAMVTTGMPIPFSEQNVVDCTGEVEYIRSYN